ncbi:HmuY family protein [Riemerella columbipharyngis]|nr:HmuY family protein [Riemerella columbipharyngis]
MKKYILGLSLLTLAMNSCSREEDDVITEEQLSESVRVETVRNLKAAPGYAGPGSQFNPNRYKLYSLAKHDTIPLTEIDTDKWDIGFQGTKIIINGGNIRTGNGGAALLDKPYETVNSLVSIALLRKDNSEQKLAIPSDVTDGKSWCQYDKNTHNVFALPKTIVLRTGDGKHFAKIKITSYYKDNEIPTYDKTLLSSGYYNFEYAYQEIPDIKVFSR